MRKITLTLLGAVGVAAVCVAMTVNESLFLDCGPGSCTRNLECIQHSDECEQQRYKNCVCVNKTCSCRHPRTYDAAERLEPIPIEIHQQIR